MVFFFCAPHRKPHRRTMVVWRQLQSFTQISLFLFRRCVITFIWRKRTKQTLANVRVHRHWNTDGKAGSEKKSAHFVFSLRAFYLCYFFVCCQRTMAAFFVNIHNVHTPLARLLNEQLCNQSLHLERVFTISTASKSYISWPKITEVFLCSSFYSETSTFQRRQHKRRLPIMLIKRECFFREKRMPE